jgi:hypothetical protein
VCAVTYPLPREGQLVKPQWLEELVRLGTLPVEEGSNATPLEQTFALPPVTKFRPALPGTLPQSLKSVKLWEPNEERLSLFQGLRFIFVIEEGREVEADIKELLRRGCGQWETFAVNEGPTRWYEALSESKRQISQSDREKALVIISDEKLMSASVGKKSWNEFVEVAKRLSLILLITVALIPLYDSLNSRFISAERILRAVFYVDRSYIDCTATTTTMTQDDGQRPLYPPLREANVRSGL